MTQPGNIYQALLRAKSAMKQPKKNQKNPHFKSDYADLPSVQAAVLPPLHDAGIVVEERIGGTGASDDSILTLRMALVLAIDPSQRIEAFWPLRPEKETQQGYGSALTYGRRYLLQTLTGCAAESDDDGNAASDGMRRRQRGGGNRPDGGNGGTSNARQAVNGGLWGALKNKARAAGVRGSGELWTIICDTLPGVAVPKTREQVQAAINTLSETDFSKLFARLETLVDGGEQAAQPPQDDREQAEGVTYDADTGEVMDGDAYADSAVQATDDIPF